MASRTTLARFRSLPPAALLVALSGMAGLWSELAAGQTGTEPPQIVPPTNAQLPAAVNSDHFLQRLDELEQRVDRLTQQNDALLRENKALAENTQFAPPRSTEPIGATGGGAKWDESSNSSPWSAGGNSSQTAVSTGGGRGESLASGGDPTSVGKAQEVGNQHLGQVPLDAFYDFDTAGFHLQTTDKEFSIGISGMTQLDAMLYRQPPPGVETSSGFYNPRSRIYFEGHATQPISWEFSLQNFYDSVALLDAYVNFNYDPRFQIQIGRYKNPFTYEFFRMHIWDLMSPERSLFATNYEANRRFGLMGHGVLYDERIEYAVGSFDTQRNSQRAFDNLQDFQAFLNFKPFYPQEESSLLRNVQFGGSVDLGSENQSPVPAVLRTNKSPGGESIDSAAASNAASTPFLAFNTGVLERGNRALWEAHLANYYEGLSFVTAIEGGHESYATGPAAPEIEIPIDGWFVQAGYFLTGETIRDRTNIQPLSPFDLRANRFGLGAWEVTARYSRLDLDSRVFTTGLADPALWTNHVKMVDVGCNWYLNQFIKVYFDWEHAMFGNPVTTTNGSLRSSSDLFWVRTQVLF